MNVKLTPRIMNWYSRLGAHVATASLDGYPEVIVSDQVIASSDQIEIELSPGQHERIAANIGENPWVALAPGQLGSIRAPYQLKGLASFNGHKLLVKIYEIYCTKPGDEAGLRLDVLSQQQLDDFDSSRWSDIEPSF